MPTSYRFLIGDSLVVVPSLSQTFDACVTDPPYGLRFMGKAWDHGIPGEPYWREILSALKPGGHLLAFGGARTYHRLTCAIEDAGFEIRDCLMWLHGNGFPKSLDVSKAIGRAAGAERQVIGYDATRARPNCLYESGALGKIGGTGKASDRTDNGATLTAPAADVARQWEGWGTALKPAWEPIILARKPLAGTVAQNVLTHGAGALNIDGCRIHTAGSEGKSYTVTRFKPGATLKKTGGRWRPSDDTALPWEVGRQYEGATKDGRWPANVVLDEEAAWLLDEQSGITYSAGGSRGKRKGGWARPCNEQHAATGLGFGDVGGASRFFYCAKASASERGHGNDHPTVKPLALMRWLVRLVTPHGGMVLDPFGGSGTTALACRDEGFSCVLIDNDSHSIEIARRRFYGDRAMASRRR
jgi:hypothetical protein